MIKHKTNATKDNVAAPMDLHIDVEAFLSTAEMNAIVSKIEIPTIARVNNIKDILTPGASNPPKLDIAPAPM